ncbi:MAG: cobamide remodeling phosphodiesterase CbiR [Desulfobacterales bacterium]
MVSSLIQSYKNRFPFRIGTTSFIYPDNYARNVKMLGPFLDEIELLYFESHSDNSLPSTKEIQELKNLADGLNLSYNIHLPTDIYLGASKPSVRMHAVDTLKRFFERTRPLSPTTNTLHLVQREKMNQQDSLKQWQDSICRSMEELIGKDIHGRDISVENLFYPIELVETIIMDFHLSVCLDIGHLVIYQADIGKTFDAWLGKTAMIHLHGAKNGKDHLSLEHMPPTQMETITKRLFQFYGTVSIEVFSFPDLCNSLNVLENYWIKIHGD